jgi:predicted nucleotidyltransferase
MEAPELVQMVWRAFKTSKAVTDISLGGSRAKGDATELSDWDLYLQGDPARLMAELPGLVAALDPLAGFWEALFEEAGYMMVMDGPLKIDLFPLGARRSLQPLGS